MGFHTYPIERAEQLEDESRYRYCSREELLAMVEPWSATVADLGSGTGFYTDDVAPYADTVYAVDVQQKMHEFYREKGVPEGVELVTAGVEDLPLSDGDLDVAYSTMTYHEFAGEAALAEVRRVLDEGGRFVTVDWSAEGEGESGPSLDERYDVEAAVELMESTGFEIEAYEGRVETYVVVART